MGTSWTGPSSTREKRVVHLPYIWISKPHFTTPDTRVMIQMSVVVMGELTIRTLRAYHPHLVLPISQPLPSIGPDPSSMLLSLHRDNGSRSLDDIVVARHVPPGSYRGRCRVGERAVGAGIAMVPTFGSAIRLFASTQHCSW